MGNRERHDLLVAVVDELEERGHALIEQIPGEPEAGNLKGRLTHGVKRAAELARWELDGGPRAEYRLKPDPNYETLGKCRSQIARNCERSPEEADDTFKFSILSIIEGMNSAVLYDEPDRVRNDGGNVRVLADLFESGDATQETVRDYVEHRADAAAKRASDPRAGARPDGQGGGRRPTR